MAVSPAGQTPATPADGSGGAGGPGRNQAFEVEPRKTALYRLERGIFVSVLRAWFRPRVVGREHVPSAGPVILAPVHRSFADFSFAFVCTPRKLFFMAKDELWKHQWLGRFLVHVGAFPVHREGADRESVGRAEEVLRKGGVLVVFPEGTRREGVVVEDLMEGAAFLSARTGAPIVPIGIGGSDLAMPKGSHLPKPRRIEVVVGPALPAPPRTGAGRVARSTVHDGTEALVLGLQAVYDAARAKAVPADAAAGTDPGGAGTV